MMFRTSEGGHDMLVEQVVNRDAPTVGPEEDVLSAVHRLLDSRSGILPVVIDERGGPRVVAVHRYRDAFAATYGSANEPATTPVEAAMSPAASTCRSSDSL